MRQNRFISLPGLLAVAILLPVIGFLLGRTTETKAPGEPLDVSPNVLATSTAPTTTVSTPKKPTTSAPQAPALSYGEAVNLYTDRRIQFTSECNVIPLSALFRNKTAVMFDNRSPKSMTFALDGVRYTLAGYGFRIITLSAKSLPHTITLDCGGGRNNAQITLQ